MTIEAKSLTELVDDFLAVVESETGVAVDTRVGSVLRALAQASSTNDLYLQSMMTQLRLDSRLSTATGDALKTFVMQFSPPFPPPIEAQAATQGPVAPTTLSAAAVTGYLLVGNIAKLAATQALELLNGTKRATTTITTVQPARVLTVAATQGATTLTVDSTAGMFPGASLDLVDGNFTASVIVQSVTDATHVNVTALSSVLSHTFATATTVVSLRNVLAVGAFSFDGTTVLGDLVSGTELRATTLLEGVKFFRNQADTSTPSIPAKSGTQSGYRVQTKLDNIIYEVVEDLTNPYYDAVSLSYKIPANKTEVYVKVAAVNAGAAYNVAAETLVVMPTPLSGVDGVINPYAITTGTDAETDDELKARFRDFISSQATATYGAVKGKIATISTDIEVSVLENVAADGVTPQVGNFVVLVGDTAGTLTPALLAQVDAAVEEVRAITTTYNVVPPTLNTPTITTVLATDGASGTQAAVQQALYNYFLGKPAGEGWNFNDLLVIAQTTEHVTDVLKFAVNGNGFDRTSGSYVVVGTGPANSTVGPLVLCRPPLANITVS